MRPGSAFCQLAQKLAFVHSVFEGLAPVDKYHWHFVVKLPPQFGVAIDIHFLPGEPASAGELTETLLHHLAKVTALAGVNHDLAGVLHGWIVASPDAMILVRNCSESKRIVSKELSESHLGQSVSLKSPVIFAKSFCPLEIRRPNPTRMRRLK